MGIKNALHKAARSGAVLLTAIGLMGVGLAVAPSADAAATTYDIGKVGTVKIADLLDVEQNNRSLNANDKAFVGETLGWKHFKAIVQLDAHIDNVGSLHEGDVVSIPLSATGRFGWRTTTIDPKIRNGVGDVLFDVSASDTAITLTRTAAPAVGALNYRLQPLVDGWYPYPASRGDSTTLTAGGSSYTFTSTIPHENYKMGNDGTHVYSNGHSASDSNTIMMRLLGGGTHDAVAQGKTPSTSTDALVYHVHVQSDQSGHAITVRGASFEPVEFVAFDAKTAGFSYDADVTGGIDTAMKEGSTSTPGGWTRKTNADGSIDLYANLGALWGDKAVRWKDGAKSYDATTNAYLKNNGNLIDQLDAVFTIGFDSTTEQRSATYTSDVTWNGKTTGLESGTFSNTPVTSGIAEGESAIEYVGNGASRGSYLLATAKPGTAATTAPADRFSRDGYTFTAWNTAMDGSGTSYRPGTAIAYPAEGRTLTLYAQWKVSSHTVTFDANGGSKTASQTVDDKAKAKEPTAPTRSDWTFAGWYLDGAAYDFDTPVTKDITLKASWRKSSTDHVDNDGRGAKTITRTGDGVYTETLKAVVKTGMTRPSIHETLSAEVRAPDLTDGKADGITVRVDGKAATGYKASYTASSRTVDVTFPTAPAEGSTITVSYTLELSDKAKTAYTSKGTAAYDATGDKGTGTTSAGMKGFATGSGTLDWDSVDKADGTPVTTPTSTGLPKAVVQAADSLPVAADGLPGTGSARAITPIIAGAGLALAAAAALAIRRLRRGAHA